MTDRKRIIICGAAGRDYHNFNVVYRDDAGIEVVAFTATQIPGIDDRGGGFVADYFELGGDSLLAVSLLQRIQETFEQAIPMTMTG